MARSKHTDKFPISNLKFLFDEQKLQLTPEYQRDAVWVRSQKQLLIDSLLHDFDVPKLYFRSIEHDGFEYEVVDGQQRLRAILGFLNDEYKLADNADAVGEHEVKKKSFNGLPTNLQMALNQVNLDVVILTGYSNEDVEDMFLRLQNGTTLQAAEKRRAIPGEMRHVVAGLAQHKAFDLSAIPAAHFGHEDAVAKILHLLLAGHITDIRPTSIEKTYRDYSHIDDQNSEVLRSKRSMNFLVKAFKNAQNPRLRKYAFITLGYLLPEMLDTYDLSKHESEFSAAYLGFEANRIKNKELPEDEQDRGLSAFTDAARSDSIPDMRYRHEFLRDYIVTAIPNLVTKDPARGFSAEQRLAIYHKDGGICQGCGKHCEDSDFHADHIKPHSMGGKTSVTNGRVLCAACNTSLGDSQAF